MTDASGATLNAAEMPPLRRSLFDAAPLLLGVALLMAGNGLTGTLLGVRAGLEGFGGAVTGIVLAGYYAGFLAGSLVAPSTIRRVGHIRVFAGLASLASAVVLVHVLQPEPLTWFALRAVSGLCVSGLYVVTETWLNGAVTNASRGALLAAYMIVVTGGIGVGQLLFSIADPRGFAAFVMASVLVSLAVVPVSLTTVRAPEVAEPHPLSLREVMATAPLGALAAAVSGFIGAAVLGAGTVYAVASGLGRGGTAAILAAALMGGLALQLPLGRWSDRTDRRLVVVVAAASGAVAALGAAAAGPEQRLLLVLLIGVAGGMAFPLYSLSIAHLNDYLEGDKVVGAGARMVLINGMGAISGPIVGAAAVQIVAPGALFVTVAAAHAVVAGYALWRLTRRPAAPDEDRASYVPFPATVAPTIAFLQEGVADELYPAETGVAEADGVTIEFRRRGSGDPVVVLPHGVGPAAAWTDGLLAALATDGVQALAAPVRSVDEVLMLLRALELPEVTLVGIGSSEPVVAELVRDHPDRVRAAVVDRAAEPTATLPVLVVEDPDVPDDVERFADLVVDFLRHDAGPAAEPDEA